MFDLLVMLKVFMVLRKGKRRKEDAETAGNHTGTCFVCSYCQYCWLWHSKKSLNLFTVRLVVWAFKSLSVTFKVMFAVIGLGLCSVCFSIGATGNVSFNTLPP